MSDKSDKSDSGPTSLTTRESSRTEISQLNQYSPTCPTSPTQISDDDVARTPEAIEAIWDAAEERARRIAAGVQEDTTQDQTQGANQFPHGLGKYCVVT
ncbi:hypothetical protein NO357_21365 [Marimonas arenosa]|uniref:Uncharacterized protein n=1 Tax=Marimonas arenosa TaxID=1795305 RepID=A0AAE3WFY4_9RHOB|nr:hypothetical protein [Marimonas arenosa]